MSAHCDVCGTDLVYREYPLMTCPVCELRAENQRLRGGIEDYLLWEPGRHGHAEAHRALAALIRTTEDSA